MENKQAAVSERKLTDRLFTIKRYPLRYLVIPKCGCTFVKNLMWSLESGSSHGSPLRIHDDDSRFLRASTLGLSVEAIGAEKYAFTVLRRPIDRFISLYTDKIIGKGRALFPPVAALLADRRGLDLAPVSIGDHQKNLAILVDWVEENIKEGSDLPRDAHWMPQMANEREIAQMKLHVLITSELKWQIPVFLGELVPGIRGYLDSVERNASRGGLMAHDLANSSLRRRIKQIYRKDQIAFKVANDQWRLIQKGLETAIPRGTPAFK